ncbi:MAG: DNA primase [Candidatus Omnitrophota bacterium]|jgi:DNA primase
MIPQSVIDQIIDRINIVDIITQYVPLKKAGRNFKSPCPFHAEKTPSFNVNSDKQIFHCFGCGVGGNVFSFLMKYEKMTFPDAVKLLAEKAGVVVPEDEARQKADEVLEPLYGANQLAANFYKKQLEALSANSRVRKYVQNRGLTVEALSKFNMGYSPDSWDGLMKAAAAKFEPATLVKAGLAIQRDDGGAYDRFRGRLMFPILDTRGRALGFGGRILDDSTPKYINSPETAVYQKSRVLYGLFEGIDAIRKADHVILVEGYMDVVACFQAGVHNAVASSGTALTVEQVRLIKKYTKQVTVLFDADQAGQSATLRGLDILVEEGCRVKVAALPTGHDPDTYVKEFSSKQFIEVILNKASALFDYKFGVLLRQFDMKQIHGKVQIANEMLSTIRRLPNEIEKNAMVRELSNRLGVREESLLVELNKQSQSSNRQVVQHQPLVARAPVKKSSLIFEKTVIGLLLSSSELWKQYKDRISVADFSDPDTKIVLEYILKASEWNLVQLCKIQNQFQENDRASFLVRQSVHEMENITHVEKAMEDCLKQLDKREEDTQRKLLRAKISECERSQDTQSLNRLLQEFAQFSKKGK